MSGPIECLLDRYHGGVRRGLPYEVHHHLEAFIRVMDDDVLFADGGKAVAVMLQHALRIARAVGLELEFGPVLGDDRLQPADSEHALGGGHDGMVQAELLAQQAFGLGVEFAVDLQLDDPASPPTLDGRAEISHEVLGLFLDLDVAVAQDSEDAVSLYSEAREQQVGETADYALDRNIGGLVSRNTDETRH